MMIEHKNNTIATYLWKVWTDLNSVIHFQYGLAQEPLQSDMYQLMTKGCVQGDVSMCQVKLPLVEFVLLSDAI